MFEFIISILTYFTRIEINLIDDTIVAEEESLNLETP